jgi:hypothetical protein
MARKEGFKGPASSSRASAILNLKGDSIIIKISSLSRIERALRAFRGVRKLGNYTGWGIPRVGDLKPLSIFIKKTCLELFKYKQTYLIILNLT